MVKQAEELPESEKELYAQAKELKAKKYGRRLIIQAVEEKGRMLVLDSNWDKPFTVLKFAYGNIDNGFTNQLFTKFSPDDYDFIVIGCSAGDLPQKEKLAAYVKNGGWILTTDWALETIVTPVFPGTIYFNKDEMQITADTVVPCQIVQPMHPFLIGVVDSLANIKDESDIETQGTPDFSWWLEGQSYPIRILDPSRVEVLIESKSIKENWGEAPVFVYFKWGKGVVLHFISHAHLQKGGSKGKFASALIITNIFDECIRSKYGIPTEVQ